MFVHLDPNVERPTVPWFPQRTQFVIAKRPLPGLIPISKLDEDLMAAQIKMNTTLMEQITELRAKYSKVTDDEKVLRKEMEDAFQAIELLQKQKKDLGSELLIAKEKSQKQMEKAKGAIDDLKKERDDLQMQLSTAIEQSRIEMEHANVAIDKLKKETEYMRFQISTTNEKKNKK